MTWKTGKLVVVGIDGGSWNVLDPWCRAEVMPTLALLRKEGSSGLLRSVIPPITPAAWTTLLTGQRPGRHRVLDFVRYDPATGALSLVNSTDLPATNLFALLQGARRQVISVNVPMTYPPPEVYGALVSGFETPSLDNTFTWPAELREEVLGVAPRYHFSVPWQTRSPEDVSSLSRDVGTIVGCFAERVRLARHLAAERPWDLLLVHLKFYDDFLHKAFGYALPDADPRGGALVQRCLAGLDKALGDLQALAQEVEAPMLLVSDHGFGALKGRVYPNALLHRWGYLGLQSWSGQLIHRVRRRLTAKRSSGDVRGLGARIPIDWRRTQAYVMFTGPCSFVYLNRRGREPHGAVAPGTEAEGLLTELTRRFRDYRHPALDGPVFEQVIPGHEFFVDHADTDPDLVLVPQEGLVPRRRLASAGNEVEPVRSVEGYHRSQGLFLAAGPNVRRGVAPEARLEDVLPTVLVALGVGLPQELDGQPLLDIFQQAPQVSRTEASPGLARPHRDVYTDEEEQELRRRLEGLGYL